MERIEGIDDTTLASLREDVQAALPSYGDPLPGSAVKLDDDIMWLGFLPARVLWGSDDPLFVYVYSPEFFGQYGYACVQGEGAYITDRAPADPGETPMPIWEDPPPEQMQQGNETHGEHQHGEQHGGEHAKGKVSLRDAREAVTRALASLKTDEARSIARERIRQARPEYLEPELGDHRHDAIPPGRHER